MLCGGCGCDVNGFGALGEDESDVEVEVDEEGGCGPVEGGFAPGTEELAVFAEVSLAKDPEFQLMDDGTLLGVSKKIALHPATCPLIADY